MRVWMRRFFGGLLLAVFCLPVLLLASPQIRIEGGNEAQRQNIEAWLSGMAEDCQLPVLRERSLLRRVRSDSEKAMQALGYYQAQLTIKLERSASCWTLRVTLVPGEPVRIADIRLVIDGEASEDPAFIDLLQSLPLAVGDVIRHDRYEQLKNRLLSLATERGYFTSQMQSQRLEIDVAKAEAVVDLHQISGPRYRFGQVLFEQDVLSDQLLARFVRFAEGDAFDNRQLLALRQSLSGSGYFADVRVQTGKPDAASLSVPVVVSANARPRYVYSAGIGFATDTGPRLRLGIENRRVNPQGHRYGVGLELSPVRSGVGFNYDIPLGDPNRERINLASSYLHENLDEYSSDRYRLGIAHLRELDSGWLTTRSLDFEREYFKVASQKDQTDLVMPGYELGRVRADDVIYPLRGWRLNGKARFAHQDLLSTVSFLQLRGQAKWVVPTWRGRILMRLEAGATLADDVTELPTSVRFFTGGDNSIRGFAYQSLGPVDDNGDVIGGRHLLVGSIEYDIPFRQHWSWAIFTDVGNAYDALADFKPVYGNGTGIRWRSPIGPVRLDIARPSEGRDNFRLHISMGMDL